MNNSTIQKTLLGLALVGVLAAPINAVYAANDSLEASRATPSRTEGTKNVEKERAGDRTATKGLTSDFCSTLSKNASTLKAKITERQKKLGEVQNERKGKVTTREQERSAKLANTRAAADANRAAAYIQLDSLAKTDAQKAAVAAFKATTEQAVVKRRAAVDEAVTAYNKSVQDAITARQTGITTIKDKFSSAVDAAITTANASCAAGTDGATVRKAFQASVKAAVTTMQSDRKELDKATAVIKTAVQTRNTAVKAAFQEFKTSQEQARKTLKAALK